MDRLWSLITDPMDDDLFIALVVVAVVDIWRKLTSPRQRGFVVDAAGTCSVVSGG